MLNLQITQASREQLPEILALYRSLMGTPGCTWDLGYPTEELVGRDISAGNLFCARDQSGALWGAAVLTDEDPDLAALHCWTETVKSPCFLARIGIAPAHQHLGAAAYLARYLIGYAAGRGCDGIHLLVGQQNPAAIRLYEKLGFQNRGEAELFEISWYCQELAFSALPV